MVLMMEILRVYYLDNYWDLMIVKCLDIMKATNWYLLIVNCLVLYFKI